MFLYAIQATDTIVKENAAVALTELRQVTHFHAYFAVSFYLVVFADTRYLCISPSSSGYYGTGLRFGCKPGSRCDLDHHGPIEQRRTAPVGHISGICHRHFQQPKRGMQ